MNWEEVAGAIVEWLIKHAPDVYDRMRVEVEPVRKILESDSPAALKLKQAQDLED